MAGRTTPVRCVRPAAEIASVAASYAAFSGVFGMMRDDPFAVGIAGLAAGAVATALQHASASRLWPESLAESRALPAHAATRDVLGRAAPAWGIAFVTTDVLRVAFYRARETDGLADAQSRLQDPMFHATNLITGFIGGLAAKAVSEYGWHGALQSPVAMRATPPMQRLTLVAAYAARFAGLFGLFGVLDAVTGLEPHPERFNTLQ